MCKIRLANEICKSLTVLRWRDWGKPRGTIQPNSAIRSFCGMEVAFQTLLEFCPMGCELRLQKPQNRAITTVKVYILQIWLENRPPIVDLTCLTISQLLFFVRLLSEIRKKGCDQIKMQTFCRQTFTVHTLLENKDQIQNSQQECFMMSRCLVERSKTTRRQSLFRPTNLWSTILTKLKCGLLYALK